jgi:hypothetical protein
MPTILLLIYTTLMRQNEGNIIGVTMNKDNIARSYAVWTSYFLNYTFSTEGEMEFTSVGFMMMSASAAVDFLLIRCLVVGLFTIEALSPAALPFSCTFTCPLLTSCNPNSRYKQLEEEVLNSNYGR